MHAVKLPVTAPVTIECEFWAENDGWHGICHKLSINVRGSSFEDAKHSMEEAFAAHIESVLRQNRREPAA